MSRRRFFFLLPFIFLLTGLGEKAFSLDPIPSDPRGVLRYPVENWRNRSYEVFSWDIFPEILIFDTASYTVQDRLFKRLAFFVEKAGFRGRLASDAEIADLHGWNAHDYRAFDLAAFFETARKRNFPLLDEERDLEDLLLRAGIIVRNSAMEIIPGRGAIISVSRESDKTDTSLRYLFMAHEGFHGIYFIDEDFRNFSRKRWDAFPSPARKFLLSFFDFQAYDTKDTALVVNEFMAHVLQRPVSQAAWYFGEHLPNRMISTSPWRRSFLPDEEEISERGVSSWPEIAKAFTAEAEAFSSYVERRWGLAAGRVWR